MFRLVSNIVASFVRTATLAQRLDDAVTFADGQSDRIKDLELELANTYRRIDALRTDVEVNQLQVEALLDHLDEIRTERDALKAERDALKAAFAEAVRQWNKLSDQLEVVTDDNLSLRRSLAEMRTERDALRNEVATIRAAATQRAAGYDSDPYDGLSPADR